MNKTYEVQLDLLVDDVVNMVNMVDVVNIMLSMIENVMDEHDLNCKDDHMTTRRDMIVLLCVTSRKH